jgi:hypothetical protein
MNILPKDHPLATVFAVGANAEPETIRLAQEVVGLILGETIIVKLTDPHRGTPPRYHGRTGQVRTINPADIEVGIDMAGTMAWFRPDEVSAL